MRIFLGMDERQPIAANVAGFSIERRSSKPVSITKLILPQLPMKRRGLTSFSFSRYIVPMLCGYQGKALFMDADVLCRGDIASFPWEHEEAVSVVTNTDPNLFYERPSVMLFNCEKCQKLTLEYIETGSPQSLEWADSVGDLPHEWNHLVGYDFINPTAKLVHFTQGIPIHEETKDSDYAQDWLDEFRLMKSSVSWEAIMGSSVHAEPVLRRLGRISLR